MDRGQPNSPPGNLNDLPDDAPQVKAAVAALRWRAVKENLEVRQSDLSDACLIRFLRCRDFDSNLAWKSDKEHRKDNKKLKEEFKNLDAALKALSSDS